MSLSHPPERARMIFQSTLEPAPHSEFVFARCQEWLLRWCSAAQRIEGNPFSIQINLGSHESMGTIRIDLKSVTQYVCLTMLRGPSQEDDFAAKWSLKIQFPALGEATPRRCSVSPARRTCTMGNYISVGLGFEGCQGIVMETGPDLCLPACVQALNGRLESGLSRWGKDRYNAQAEAHACYPAN